MNNRKTQYIDVHADVIDDIHEYQISKRYLLEVLDSHRIIIDVIMCIYETNLQFIYLNHNFYLFGCNIIYISFIL